MISYEEQAAAGLAAYGEDPKALLLAIESSCDETAAAVVEDASAEDAKAE